MPPLKLIDHQPISLNAGNYSYSVTADDDVNMVVVRVARQTTATPTFFDAACSFMLEVFVAKSQNQEVPLDPWFGFGATGGILLNRRGVEIPESSALAMLPPGVDRRMRVDLTVAGARLVSEITVETIQWP